MKQTRLPYSGSSFRWASTHFCSGTTTTRAPSTVPPSIPIFTIIAQPLSFCEYMYNSSSSRTLKKEKDNQEKLQINAFNFASWQMIILNSVWAEKKKWLWHGHNLPLHHTYTNNRENSFRYKVWSKLKHKVKWVRI